MALPLVFETKRDFAARFVWMQHISHLRTALSYGQVVGP